MYKKTIIASLLALVWISGFGQEDNDMLYIFPSKDVYETGEDMWFKAYLMDRQTLALSLIMKESRSTFYRNLAPKHLGHLIFKGIS